MEEENIEIIENETVVDSDFKDAKPKNTSKLIICLVCVVLVLGVLLGVKFLYLDNPARVFVSNIKTLKESLTTSTEKIKLFNGNKSSVEIETMGILFDTIGLNDLKKYTINVNTEINSNEKEGKVNLVFKDGNSSKKIDIDVTYLNGSIYYNFNDAYKNTLEQKLDTEESKELDTAFDQVDTENIEKTNYLIDKVLSLLIDSIDKNDFSKTSSSIS